MARAGAARAGAVASCVFAALLLLVLAAAPLRGVSAAPRVSSSGVRAGITFSSDAAPRGAGGAGAAGAATPTKRGRGHGGASAPPAWTNVTLSPPFGLPPRGYDPPAWRRAPPPGRRVTLRGWLSCADDAPPGAPVFTLPPAAWPARDEPFAVAFKGRDRALRVSAADGVARLVRARACACTFILGSRRPRSD
jgi:hypothetical protein